MFSIGLRNRFTAAAGAAALLAACSGGSPSAVPSTALNTSAVRPQGVVPTGAPSPTPLPTASATPCAGGFMACLQYTFVMPLSAHERSESLALESAGGDDNRCNAFEASPFQDETESLALAPSYTIQVGCSSHDRDRDRGDSAHRMGVVSNPGSTPTPSPTATPNAGGSLYIVQIAVTCGAGRHDDAAVRRMDDHHGDDDGCNASSSNATVAAIAGPAQVDGSGNATFPSLVPAVAITSHVHYFYFIANYTGAGSPATP